ncbi:MAG: toxin-antitoxin system HicB family antitoxin, partial [Dehalococcoidia bacterium]|nr:toxin-antitoxin system HicB family antitoxin [Dehalococcoidia bacterium]
RFAEAVNAEVGAHYQVVLSYRRGALDLEIRQTEPSEPTEEAWSTTEGEIEKVTLRLPAELKELATEAAAKAGLSVNAWFVRVLARALRSAEPPDAEPPARPRRGRHGWHERHEQHGQPGQRLSGWVGTGDE